jgi:ATP-dependent Clp protease adaptor protein ClpS
MPPAETRPDVRRPEAERETHDITKILPPYQVVLYNDDVHEMTEVVRAIVRSVNGVGLERATRIMLEAHFSGKARVIVCPKELAELYRERLQTYGLTVTIEPA